MKLFSRRAQIAGSSKLFGLRRFAIHWQQESWLLAGVATLALLLLALLVWDGYIFYGAVIQKQELPPEQMQTLLPTFSETRINETIQNLDARERQLQALLAGAASATPPAPTPKP